jgi:hypothetical protein
MAVILIQEQVLEETNVVNVERAVKISRERVAMEEAGYLLMAAE